MSLLVAAAWCALDQLSKLWVVENLPIGLQRPVIPGLLSWQHIRNSGAAFSLGSDYTWVFTIVMAVVIGAILWNLRRVRDPLWAFALGLVLGGAAGNFIDRLFREPGFARGHVVDFISVPRFAIFNVADCGVVVGVVLILVMIMTNRRMEALRGR